MPPMPPIGFGTSPGEGLRPADLAAAIGAALTAGFRLFDTAEVYGSESVLGERIAASGVPRDELFVASKLWRTNHAFAHAVAACEGSLRRLGLDHLDLYLIHAPEPWRHVGPLDLDAGLSRAEIAERAIPRGPGGGGPEPADVPLEETWGALVELRRRGLARRIGIANAGVETLERLAAATGEAAEAIQAEIHPGRPEDDLVAHCAGRSIAVMAHSPLGGGAMLRDPEVLARARDLGASPAQAVLRWHLERGVVPIPGSHRPEHARENFGALLPEAHG
jgi:diketogulonate reductase-like aldo/keto reductase